MDWIFLSPHLDDAALSCGGFIAELVKQGHNTEVWTVCAGDPPPGPLSPLAQSLHQRWGTTMNAMDTRRQEDHRSCRQLGAGTRHFSIPDCIYRRHPVTREPLIRQNEELFQPLPEVEKPLVTELSHQLAALLPNNVQLVSPLTMGGHIDHHLVRHAAESLNHPLLYYADFPYAIQTANDRATWIQPGWRIYELTISQSSVSQWQASIAEHKSQISTFWGSLPEMKQAILEYWHAGGGNQLWGKFTGDIHNNYAN